MKNGLQMMTRVTIVGLGYVGLCTAVCFANRGHNVVGVEIDLTRLNLLKNGRSPIFEKNLDRLLTRSMKNRKLSFTDDYDNATDSELIFITVGTPSLPNGAIDLSQIRSASFNIGKALVKKKGYKVIVVKSTVLPGTAEGIVAPLVEHHSNKEEDNLGFCSNPEFLREGSAIEDTLHPARIVIGARDKKSGETLRSFYTEFHGRGLPPVIMTNMSTAELVKYANNAFLAMKVSYINSIARICERVKGCDVQTIAEGIGLDSRIGKTFLEAGPGYGGSCLPKDVKALIAFSTSRGLKPSLLKVVEETNAEQAEHLIAKSKGLLGNLEGKRISILGLAFKTGTDDIRESPSLKVIEGLLSSKAQVSVYDPKANESARKVFGKKVCYGLSPEDCIRDTDLCMILTGWPEFSKLTADDFSRLMTEPRLIDSRRIYDPRKFMGRIQFAAIGVGQ